MLLEYIWLLGTFVNSSCDIKINVNIVQNCCRNLAVRGLTVITSLHILCLVQLQKQTLSTTEADLMDVARRLGVKVVLLEELFLKLQKLKLLPRKREKHYKSKGL